MPKTPISASTPYASPADYLSRVDVRLTGDLSRDDGSQATPTELLTDPNLLAALVDASAMVEASVLVSERYDVADLQALTGNSLGLLKRIVCGLAVQFLRERRGLMEESEYGIYKQAMKWLEALHAGQMVFAFQETVASGLPSVKHLQPNDFFYGTPTLTSNWIRSFGIRANRKGYGGF